MGLAKLCVILIVLLASPRALFGAGGTCPKGANYLSLSNPTGAKVALSSFGVTSCYYIAANGSDSNSGTSESSPWEFAPGMGSCASNCLAVQKAGPAAGSGFIFRGGDTWHLGNSSAPPYTGGGWAWYAWSGTSSSFIYIGVDPSWYSGSSWTRPILTSDNPTSTSPVSSCSYSIARNPQHSDAPANTTMWMTSTEYVIFDDFELTGLCWSTPGNGEYVFWGGSVEGGGNVAYIENNYIHGWTHTAAGQQTGGQGFGDYSQTYGAVKRFNVVDGSDTDMLSLSPWGEGSSGYDLEYNVTYNAMAEDTFDACHVIHDNLFENITQLTDGSGHSDLVFCVGEVAGGSSDPNLFYNNVFKNIGSSSNPYSGYVLAPDTPLGQTDYFFNNVFHDVWDNAGGNNNAICDQGATGGSNCGPAVMWNNTAESGINSSGPVGIVWANTGGGQNVSVTSVNDHWISNGGSSSLAVFNGPSLVSESDPVYQTLSAANGQGYTSANDFSPASSSAATVTASGANETNGYCADSVLHNAAAEAACKEGITGVSYDQTNHTVVYPAYPAVSRPATGAWEVGAFEEAPAAQVNPPTNLSAAVQ